MYIHAHGSNNIYTLTKLDLPLLGMVEDGVLHLHESVSEERIIDMILALSPRLQKASLKPILAITIGSPHKEHLFSQNALIEFNLVP